MRYAKQRTSIRAAALLLCFLLTGCASLYEYEYYEKLPHEETEAEQGDLGEAEVSDFAALKQAVLRMIRGGLEKGNLRAIAYQGDFARDVDIALKEVRSLEPLGAYAVDYMSSELSPMPPQNAATIYINYRRTASVETVRRASGTAGLRALVREALTTRQKTLVAELSYYNPEDHNIPLMLEQEYFDSPAHALGLPSCAVSLYPTDAQDYMPRIMEITLDYWGPSETLLEQERVCEERMDALLAEMPDGLNPPASVLWLHDALAASVTFDEATVMNDIFTGMPQKTASYTLFGALADGFAVSEGYALALKLGCDRLGIECMIVKGRRSNFDHRWNLVRLDGAWYHVDTAADDSGPAPTHEWFLLGDGDMNAVGVYSWGDAYPAAPPGALSYETVAGIETPPDAFPFPEESPEGSEEPLPLS